MGLLKTVPAFQDYLATLGDKPIMGVLIGTGLTMLIQSSAAIIGILQGLYAGHLPDLQGSTPILLGSNIDTCITAVIAAIGSNIAAKRVAGAQVLLNVVVTVLFMILLVPFTSLMQWMEVHFKLTPAMTVAFATQAFEAAFLFVETCNEKYADKTQKFEDSINNVGID